MRTFGRLGISLLLLALLAAGASASAAPAPEDGPAGPDQPVAITTQRLPGGVVNLLYSKTLETTTRDRDSAYVWGVRDGALPPGLSLTSVAGLGLISGRPAQSGTFTLTVEVSEGQVPIAAHQFSIAVVDASADEKAPVPPEWVFEPWVWEDDVNTGAEAVALVQGYRNRGIPVGVVIIDSPWATDFNTFVFDASRYPEAREMVAGLHAQGVRVINWMRPVMCTTAGDAYYDGPKSEGYFVNGGQVFQTAKCPGSFVDYTNPAAVAWWHGLMDRVLRMGDGVGVDGWKADGGHRRFPAATYAYAGLVTQGEYSRLHYEDTYEYAVQQRGDAITFVKPFNDQGTGYLDPLVPRAYAPAAWVDDQTHDWGLHGLLNGLNGVFQSSESGYVAVGSDIGGYTGVTPITKSLLIRWTQFGALSPIMENGGQNPPADQVSGLDRHRPWEHDAETVDVYRYFAKLHSQLVPYLYSYAVDARGEGMSIVRPQPGWDSDDRGQKWQYKLGRDLFVAAMYEDVTSREVAFPAGDRWIDYWDDDQVYEGGTRSADYASFPPYSLDRYPIFIREGAIIPMRIREEHGGETGHGSAASDGYLTVLFYCAAVRSSFTLHQGEEDGGDVTFDCSPGADAISIDLSPSTEDFIFRVKLEPFTAPISVQLGGRTLGELGSFGAFEEAGAGWTYGPHDDGASGYGKPYLWIKFSTGSAPETVSIATQRLETAQVTYQFPASGWHMVSLPVEPLDARVSALFPSAASAAFEWDPLGERYNPVTVFRTTRGYWLLVPEPITVPVVGAPVYAYTKGYPRGWHMIGSVLGGDVDWSDPNDDPDGAMLPLAYGWDRRDQRYYLTTTLSRPTEGYWALALKDAGLGVGDGVTPTAPAPATLRRQAASPPAGEHIFAVALDFTPAPASGSVQRLILVGHPDGSAGYDAYDVAQAPPAPGGRYHAYFKIGAFPGALQTDARPWAYPHRTALAWDLRIASVGGMSATLTWDPSALPPVPGTFTLSGVDGGPVDMRRASSALVPANATTLRISYRPESSTLFLPIVVR